MSKLIGIQDIKDNFEIRALIKAANTALGSMGYTEHGLRHVGYVSDTTQKLLLSLGHDDREAELGAIAGWIHDIGNSINRLNHGLTGAGMAFVILRDLGMDIVEILKITTAIGNHEDNYGHPVSAITAALILADKSDSHKTRVRKYQLDINNIHDRVNLSIKKSFLTVNTQQKIIKLVIYMDHQSAPMEYLQIYMSRMVLCERAADFLRYTFELVINDMVLNHHNKVGISVKSNLEERDEVL